MSEPMVTEPLITQENYDSFREMVTDAAGPEFDWNTRDEPEALNPTVQKIFKMKDAANSPLWPGCEDYSELSALSELLNIKSESNLSEWHFNRFLKAFERMLPKGHKLPDSFYSSKKVVAPLGLGVDKIDACENDCMLYWKDDKELRECKICHHPRLYTSKTTAEHMSWHKDSPCEDGKLCHPRDGEAWKHFDRTHPTFADEARNVSLALSSDGFNPHNQTSRPYSCWPVIVTPYNLPPWMCMDQPYMFLTLLVPGPRSPGKSLDVYLQPLIDELETLWNDGVETYDVFKKQNFQMRAALMWTISDFPAYGMLSGWSTHGKLACPYCMNGIKSFRLKHGVKSCFFDCHRQFLPLDHPYRYQKDNFTKGRLEMDSPLIRLTGEELEAAVASLPNIQFGKTKDKERIEGFGETHNWLKRSIFWDLPYWNTNLIRHNLDVMHIEKNMFDNVFNTVMDVKGKTKDNVKARLDLQNICKCRDLELKEMNGKYLKPKANYTLSKDERQIVLKWIKNLRLPDGYASNLARCVNLDDCSLHGMKSHDCHVLMERLLPIAFRDLLPESVWNGLTELSKFFRDLCSTILSEPDMKKMEDNIAVTLFLNTLKRKVKNKARVEGSIVEAYLIEETSTFCSHFFAPEVVTRSRTIGRNDNVNQVESSSRLSVFKCLGRPFSPKDPNRTLSPPEKAAATIYIILNCPEISEYVDQQTPLENFYQELNSDPARIILDNELDDVAILADVNSQEEEEKFTWHAQWSEQQVYNIFKSYYSRSFSAEMMRLRTVKKSRSASPPDYMRQDIWDALWDIWDTDKFKKLQENNRKNRVSDRDGNGTVKSSAGTVPIPLHARRMETYTRLKENHPQSSGSAMLSQGSSTFIPEASVEASGGPKNGRCYGFGNSYSASFTSCGTFPNNNSSPAEVQQLKEEMREIKREQQEIKTSLSEILSFIRACQANFSGQHFSPGQYSSSQHSAPSPGQYPPSALTRQYPPSAPAGQYPPSAPAGQYPPSTPAGQYPPSASAPSHSQYPATGSGQYLPTAPGYYPAPHPGYFMTPATQFHGPGHYQASSQHPAVHCQLPDQVPSPSQHNSFSQRHSQE
ncbi:hypothetical protein BUALT_Bualt10G0094200 [Buddleja alternifolia]|uniref:DUF4218 domain-containing protein n=1 Tax=Buddleja alternifolia TaxID=168488 RepID=A0AAV6X4K1_9LAMI|nr:hypothetical protein BUALT_Bualt10G0094200 [Buddleja alternifolia]